MTPGDWWTETAGNISHSRNSIGRPPLVYPTDVSLWLRLSIFDGAYLFKHTHVVRIMCKSARLHDAPAVRHIRTAPYQKSKQIHYLKSVKARHRSAGQRCIKHAACMGRNPAACLQFSQQWSEGCIRCAWLVCILMQGEIILGITMITE